MADETLRAKARELEHAARLARWFGLSLVAIAALAMMILAIGSIYMGAQVRSLVREAVVENQHQAQTQQLTADIVVCLFGKVDLHQQASQEFFTKQNAPGTPPPKEQAGGQVDPVEVQGACERALKAVRTGKVNGG